MAKTPGGVNDVVAENAQLKQSIILFQSEVQKHVSPPILFSSKPFLRSNMQTTQLRERQNRSMIASRASPQKQCALLPLS
jgi:hypothetical protein